MRREIPSIEIQRIVFHARLILDRTAANVILLAVEEK
jgi:hypothetical protein